MSNAVASFPLSARARAMLRAVAEGRTRRGFEALLQHHAVPMPRVPEREAG